MRDALEVTTTAAKGLTDKLAEFWEITASRVSEIFGKDNSYPKFRRMLRGIACVCVDLIERRERLEPVRADFNAFIDELIGESCCDPVETSVLCDELCDVIKAKVADKPRAAQLKELREAKAAITQEINALMNQGKKKK